MKKITFLFIICVLISVEPFFAQEIKKAEDLFRLSLEEFLDVEIVSVSKKTEKYATAPGTVYVVTAEEINMYGFLQLQDALKYIASVYLYDPHSWVWGGQRGLVSNFSQTLLMINGREVNNIIAQEGFISRQFATHNIERIEVMATPGSALYGANALAGVINIITKDANIDFEGFEVSQEFGSYNTIASSFVFGKKFGDISIKGSIRQFNSSETDLLDFVKDTVNYSKGWADNKYANQYLKYYKNPSEARPINFQLDYKGLYFGMNYYFNKQSHGLEKLRWNYTDGEDIREMKVLYGGIKKQISEMISLSIDYQHISSFMWGRYHSGFWPITRLQSNSNVDIYQIPENVSTSSGTILNGIDEIKGYYNSFAHYLIDQSIIDSENITSTDIQRYFNHIYTNKNSRGSQRQKLNMFLNLCSGKRTTIDFGYEFDNVDYVGLAVSDAGVNLGASYDIPLDLSKREEVYTSYKHSLYAQVNHTFIKNTLWLVAGSRFDNQNHYGHTFNPRCGLIIQPSKKDIVKFMYGEAYREPNVFELSSNTNLSPAKLRSFEANYSHNFGTSARISLAGYHNIVSDFIGSVGSIIGTGIGKVEKQKATGSEFRFDLKTGKLISFVNGAFIFDIHQDVYDEIQNKTERSEVLSIPKEKINIGISHPVYKKLSASILYSYVNKYEAISGNTAIVDPYTVDAINDLKFTLHWMDIDLNDLKLNGFITINNLLDQEYYHPNIRRSGTHKFLQDGRNIHMRLIFSI